MNFHKVILPFTKAFGLSDLGLNYFFANYFPSSITMKILLFFAYFVSARGLLL